MQRLLCPLRAIRARYKTYLRARWRRQNRLKTAPKRCFAYLQRKEGPTKQVRLRREVREN